MTDSRVAYTVGCVIQSHDVAERWLSWLTDRHLDDVCAAGAIDAEIVELDTDEDVRHFEVRYHFASRDALDTYVRDHAPRLRDEGLQLFPLELGLAYARTVGVVRGAAHRA